MVNSYRPIMKQAQGGCLLENIAQIHFAAGIQGVLSEETISQDKSVKLA